MSNQIITKLTNTIEKLVDELNSRVTTDLDINTLFKIDTEIQEIKTSYDSLLETQNLIVSNDLLSLQNNLNSLISTVQTKLENGDFKGDRGDKGLDFINIYLNSNEIKIIDLHSLLGSGTFVVGTNSEIYPSSGYTGFFFIDLSRSPSLLSLSTSSFSFFDVVDNSVDVPIQDRISINYLEEDGVTKLRIMNGRTHNSSIRIGRLI